MSKTKWKGAATNVSSAERSGNDTYIEPIYIYVRILATKSDIRLRAANIFAPSYYKHATITTKNLLQNINNSGYTLLDQRHTLAQKCIL